MRKVCQTVLWYLGLAWRWILMQCKNVTKKRPSMGASRHSSGVLENTTSPERLIPASFVLAKKPRTLDEISADLQDTLAERENLYAEKNRKKAPLLAIERETAEQIDNNYDPLIEQCNQRERELKREYELAKMDHVHSRLDISFLKLNTWSLSQECALPRYAIFSPDSAFFRLQGSYTQHPVELLNGFRLDYNCDSRTSNLFDTTGLKQLGAKRIGSVSEGYATDVAIGAIFSGSLTDAARALLKNTTRVFENIYLITKAPDWQVSYWAEAIAQPVSDGPAALIGRCGDNYWLIEQAEKAVA